MLPPKCKTKKHWTNTIFTNDNLPTGNRQSSAYVHHSTLNWMNSSRDSLEMPFNTFRDFLLLLLNALYSLVLIFFYIHTFLNAYSIMYIINHNTSSICALCIVQCVSFSSLWMIHLIFLYFHSVWCIKFN